MNIRTIYKNLNVLQKKDVLDSNDVLFLKLLSTHSDEDIRWYVSKLLVKDNSKMSEDILMGMTSDIDDLVRANACDSLCISKNINIVNLLKNIVRKDKNSIVRSYAVLSMGDVSLNLDKSKCETISFLKDRLKVERVINVKISIYRSLCLLGAEEYLGYLLHELNGMKYQNRCAVINALFDLVNEKNNRRIKKAVLSRKKAEKSNAVLSSIESLLEDKLLKYKDYELLKK
jgi:hypothetical protein